MNREDKTSYTTNYQEAFLKYVENEYCAKHPCVPVIKHESLPSSDLIPSAMVLGSCQSSSDAYDLCRDDDEYSTPNNVAESIPGTSDHAAGLLTAARLYFNSPPEAPNN